MSSSPEKENLQLSNKRSVKQPTLSQDEMDQEENNSNPENLNIKQDGTNYHSVSKSGKQNSHNQSNEKQSAQLLKQKDQ